MPRGEYNHFNRTNVQAPWRTAMWNLSYRVSDRRKPNPDAEALAPDIIRGR